MKIPTRSLLLALSLTITGACTALSQGSQESVGEAQHGASPLNWRSLRAQAEAGDADCAYELGRRYENGIGVRQSGRNALRWYRLSARQNCAKAQYGLGRLLASGELGRADFAEAVLWLQRSAARGHSLAQNRLGVIYQRGEGTSPDLVEAFRWFTLAARRQPFGAASANLRALAAQLTPAQIAEGERRAGADGPVDYHAQAR